jgi:hypothetical protein
MTDESFDRVRFLGKFEQTAAYVETVTAVADELREEFSQELRTVFPDRADRYLITLEYGLGDPVSWEDWRVNWSNTGAGIRFYTERDSDGDAYSCLVPTGWILNPAAWMRTAATTLPRLRQKAQDQVVQAQELRLRRVVREFREAGGDPATLLGLNEGIEAR